MLERKRKSAGCSTVSGGVFVYMLHVFGPLVSQLACRPLVMLLTV